MAVLSDNDRAAAWAELMRRFDGVTSLSKADLRAAVNAVDDWVDSNSSSFNTALPQPARSTLTAKQKAQVLVYVVTRRSGVL